MGTCYSEPAEKDTKVSEKDLRLSETKPIIKVEPEKEFSLAENGFAAEQRVFLEKVKQNSTMLSKEDLPLSWREQTVRKFDVDTFLQLCQVIKEKEGNDGHSDAGGAWECQFHARWGDATKLDEQVAACCGGWKVAYASQLIK